MKERIMRAPSLRYVELKRVKMQFMTLYQVMNERADADLRSDLRSDARFEMIFEYGMGI